MFFAALIDLQRWWPLAAAAAATTLLMFRLQTRRRQRVKSEPTSMAPSSNVSRPPRAVEQWEAELFEYCREVEGRIDTKIAALQQLILSADARIAHLENLGLDGESSSPDGPGGEPLQGPHFAEVPARQAAVFAMADAGHDAATIANRLQTSITDVEMLLLLRRADG